MSLRHRCCVFGEVLVDIFPDGRHVLGGAPFNVAWHLQAFDAVPRFISRVGDDTAGRAIRRAMSEWGMDTAFLQTDKNRPTGRVTVRIEKDEPHYDIVPDCAYDFIASEPQGQNDCNLLYHGTLALRNPASEQALLDLKTHFSGTLFMDANLRAPWWSREMVLALIQDADWVKLNERELELLDLEKQPLRIRAQRFRETHALKGLVVTRGEAGAIAFTENAAPIEVKPAHTPQVVDTVGAGDAFSAVLLLGLSRKWPLALTMARAGEFAAQVLGKRGATIQEQIFYQSLLQAWQSASRTQS